MRFSVNKDKWPPISRGATVVTTQPNERLRGEWVEGVWEKRQWGVRGTIHTHHDSHGLSYEVRHPDGSIGHYDPSEIEELSDEEKKVVDAQTRWMEMRNKICDEGLDQIFGLMWHGGTALAISQALGIPIEDATRHTQRVMKIISQYELPG